MAEIDAQIPEQKGRMCGKTAIDCDTSFYCTRCRSMMCKMDRMKQTYDGYLVS